MRGWAPSVSGMDTATTTPALVAEDRYEIRCPCGATLSLTGRQARVSRAKYCGACGRVVPYLLPQPCDPIKSHGLGTWFASCPCGWTSGLIAGAWDDPAAINAAIDAHRPPADR